MSPISLALNLLLAGLLTLTLMFGWRLSRQLKALKDSHAGFAHAVGDLDRAAQRAEVGLTELRTSTDQAVDLLVGRIDKARDLAKQLEILTVRAEAAAEKARTARPAAAPSAAGSPIAASPAATRTAAAPQPQVRSIFDRPRASTAPSLRQTSDEDAEAAAEALILRLSESEVLTSDAPPSPRESAAVARARLGGAIERQRAETRPERRFDSLFGPRGGVRAAVAPEPEPEIRRAEPRPNPRSRAQIDEDLFDPPARGGRLRAFDGGRS